MQAAVDCQLQHMLVRKPKRIVRLKNGLEDQADMHSRKDELCCTVTAETQRCERWRQQRSNVLLLVHGGTPAELGLAGRCCVPQLGCAVEAVAALKSSLAGCNWQYQRCTGKQDILQTKHSRLEPDWPEF